MSIYLNRILDAAGSYVFVILGLALGGAVAAFGA
jgi:hypothetical protein